MVRFSKAISWVSIVVSASLILAAIGNRTMYMMTGEPRTPFIPIEVAALFCVMILILPQLAATVVLIVKKEARALVASASLALPVSVAAAFLIDSETLVYMT